MSVHIELYRDASTKELQVMIGDEHGGYRLLGPNFRGDSHFLGRRELTKRDADSIRFYLDKVPNK